MILVDYSGLAIAALTQDTKDNSTLFRHKILNAIRNINFKFKNEYGELVICCDCKNQSWRKQKYDFYKATRKKDDYIDWDKIYEYMEIVRSELIASFPYKIIQVDSAEADDIIATLCKLSQVYDLNEGIIGKEPKKVLIASRDGDFIQLQKYANVGQYNSIDKKFIKPEVSAARSLFEKVVRGDGGDSICNVLSPNDSLLTKTRQKPVKTVLLDEWYKDNSLLLTTEEIKTRWNENQELINFEYIPKELQKTIIRTYLDCKPAPKSNVLKYLIANQMPLLIEHLNEF